MAILTRDRFRRMSTAQWALRNPILLDGEPGWDSDLHILKVGDGETAWSSLASITSGGGGGGGGGSYQPLDTDLTAIAGLVSSANRFPYATGTGTWAMADISAFGRSIVDDADAAAARTTLGITLAPVRFSASSAVTTATGSDRAEGNRVITSARMRVTDAPVGSALIAQVQHWNGSVWSTVTTLTINAGSTTEAVSTGLNQAQVAGNLIRLNVTSVGSTTPAKGAVVDVFVS